MKSTIKLISGSSNFDLAKKISDNLEIPLTKLDVLKFANENIKVKISESVRGQDVFFIQSSQHPVNEMLVETLIVIDALKNSSAARITAVLPYYPYVRADKKDEPRISITARLVADLLQTAGADRVLTMNLHSPQIQGFFSIPTDQLTADRIIVKYLMKRDLSNSVVVAPDAGSAKRAGRYAKKLDLPLAILDKRRFDDNDMAEIFHVVGDVKGKNVIIFDDEIATANSILGAENALRMMSVKNIIVFAVHGVLVGGAVERLLMSSIDEVIVTNTIHITEDKKWEKLTILDVSEHFSESIRCIHNGESFHSLF